MAVYNPFARGEMPGFATRTANEIIGDGEYVLSTGRLVALQYGSYEIQAFGRAWGLVFVYEDGNLQEIGYINYDAILALRDLGSRIYEVRYGEQETAWDENYSLKYECYGKRVRDGIVTLTKWGDCAPRQLNLTKEEYQLLCAGIERMPDHHDYFPDYKTRVRPRVRGEHRYSLQARASGVRTKDGERDKYGRRCYGYGRPVMPLDRGYGRIDSQFFLLGEPEVWTARCSEQEIFGLLRGGKRNGKASRRRNSLLPYPL